MAEEFPKYCYPYIEWIQYADANATAIIIMYSILLIVSIPASTLNALILVTIYRQTSLQTPSNIFLCNLALSDFIVGVLALPLAIVWKYIEIYNKDKDVLCPVAVIAFSLSSLFAGISILTVTAASVDRFLALYLHLSYASFVTTKRVIIACAIMWVASLVIALILLSGFSNYNFVTSVVIPGCTIISSFCFYKIFKVIKYHHNQISSQMETSQTNQTLPNMARYRRSVISLIYVLGLFLVSVIPYTCSMIIFEVLGGSPLILLSWNVGTFFVYLNSSLNPVLYCWRIREIRTAVKDTVMVCFSCTREKLFGGDTVLNHSDRTRGVTRHGTMTTAHVIRVRETNATRIASTPPGENSYLGPSTWK